MTPILPVLAARPAARLAAIAGALLLAACATTPLPPSGTPPAPDGSGAPGAPALPALGWFSRIKVPDGQQPVLRLAASGVQVFRCEQRPEGWQWQYRLPEAELRDARGEVVVRHGVNFSFEHVDGSRLLGTVVASDAAPSDADLRWLLLSTRSFGNGLLAGIGYVQRINTAGGMPPPGCEARQANQLLRVHFSADFVFYRPG